MTCVSLKLSWFWQRSSLCQDDQTCAKHQANTDICHVTHTNVSSAASMNDSAQNTSHMKMSHVRCRSHASSHVQNAHSVHFLSSVSDVDSHHEEQQQNSCYLMHWSWQESLVHTVKLVIWCWHYSCCSFSDCSQTRDEMLLQIVQYRVLHMRS